MKFRKEKKEEEKNIFTRKLVNHKKEEDKRWMKSLRFPL